MGKQKALLVAMALVLVTAHAGICLAARGPAVAPPTVSMQQAGEPPIAVHLPRDLQLTFAGLVISLTAGADGMPTRDPAFGTGSGAMFAASLALPHVAGLLELAFDSSRDGAVRLGEDTIVLLETLALSSMVTQLANRRAQSSRHPFDSNRSGEEDRAVPQGSLSLLSTTTTLTFSMATSYSLLFSLRHPESPWKAPLWVGSHALAGTAAVLQALAGERRWSEVMTSAAVGSAMGVLVPLLNTAQAAKQLLADLRLNPVFHQGGFGLNLMLFW